MKPEHIKIGIAVIISLIVGMIIGTSIQKQRAVSDPCVENGGTWLGNMRGLCQYPMDPSKIDPKNPLQLGK